MEIAVVAYTSLCTVTRKVDSSVVEPGWTLDGAVDSCWRRRRRSGGCISFASSISEGEVSKKEVRILNIDGGATAATSIDTSDGENEKRQSHYGMIGDPHIGNIAFLPFVEEVEPPSSETISCFGATPKARTKEYRRGKEGNIRNSYFQWEISQTELLLLPPQQERHGANAPTSQHNIALFIAQVECRVEESSQSSQFGASPAMPCQVTSPWNCRTPRGIIPSKHTAVIHLVMTFALEDETTPPQSSPPRHLLHGLV